jgi:hypothetical protein
MHQLAQLEGWRPGHWFPTPSFSDPIFTSASQLSFVLCFVEDMDVLQVFDLFGTGWSLYTAVALLGLQLVTGLMMSIRFRLGVISMPKDKYKELLDGKDFKVASATQLNNAEWTPSLVAGLLYLHSQGTGSNLLSLMVSFGSFGYVFWKLYTNGKPTPISASMRYMAFALMIYEIYLTAA